MEDHEVWELERRFWTSGLDFYERHLDQECLMALPGVGVLEAAEVLESIGNGARWDAVDLSECSIATPGEATVVIAYRASAERRGSPSYGAICTSTYHATDTGWKLIQHQQTLVR